MTQSDSMRLETFAGYLGKAILSLSPKGCEVELQQLFVTLGCKPLSHSQLTVPHGAETTVSTETCPNYRFASKYDYCCLTPLLLELFVIQQWITRTVHFPHFSL